ncbi:MAG: hypothetical protein WBA44_10395 [Mesorhizobium sp.]
MIRFIFRLAATLSLAVAVIMAVSDATRSIAISKFDPTPIGAAWLKYAPDSLGATQAWLTANAAFLWDPVLLQLLRTPGFVAFAILALLLYAIGYRRQPAAGRFAA